MFRCATGLVLAALALAGCESKDKKYARAFEITSLDQAIGGPKATAREGDLLLENDQIRVVIEQGGPSRLPLGQGGSIIDIDLNRPQREYRSGNGLDQVGQFVPVANLYQVAADFPTLVQITGSSEGAEVTSFAEGAPIIPLVDGLSLLLQQRFADAPDELRLYNEIEVRPGERMLRITTTFGFGVPFCPVQPGDGCNPECHDALYDDDCDCPAVPARCTEQIRIAQADPLPDRDFGGILHVLAGDLPVDRARCDDDVDCDAGQTCVPVTEAIGGDLKVCRAAADRDAGVLLGDMLIFAKNTSPFFRGPGFDTESDIRRLFDAGFDTLRTPLEVDAIYAVGDGVSYGYTSPQGTMLVPVLSGPFSMGAPAAASCPTDQPGCLNQTLVRFERWLSVGEGDVSSAAAVLARARGAAIGRVTGSVVSSPSGQPLSGAKVFALADPRALPCDGACQARCDLGELSDQELAAWSLDQVLEANRCRTQDEIFLSGHGGLENMAVVDPVGDPVKDGGYALDLPPGRYVLVARKDMIQSSLGAVEVEDGRTSNLSFLMAEPARLEYVILDQTGQPGPGRITVGRCLPGPPCGSDADCSGGTTCQQSACACERILPVPLELGGGRLVDGVWAAEHTLHGMGSIDLPPGEYEVVFSRGPEFTIDDHVITVQSNRSNRVTGQISRSIDRIGWSTSDFHIHAAPSIDSELPLEDRVIGMIANDMDYFSSSDHDVITDYAPLVQTMDVRRQIGTQIGLEVSPNDLGHFIGFPLAYRLWQEDDGGERSRLGGNGAPNWHGMSPDDIFGSVLGLENEAQEDVIVNVPHPHSYFDAYRLDPVTLEPVSSFLTVINPLVDPSFFSGSFDALEVMNSKSFDLIRRPTAGEVRFFSGEFDKLRAALRSGELDAATYDRRLSLLMTEATRRMLHRTVEEQDAAITGVGGELPCTCGSDGDCATGLVCDPSTLSCVDPPLPPDLTPAPDAAMCRTTRGIVDDWFLMLNRGVVKTGLSGSDVHDEEAGTIRTFLRTGPVTAPNLSSREISKAIRAHAAVVSTGPMIHFRVDQAEVGDKIGISSGQAVDLYVRVEKAPWYDVDRVEIYRNGRLIHWVSGCQSRRTGDAADPHGHPCVEEGDGVVVFEETIRDTPERDSWYAVIAVGLDGRSLAPIYRSVNLSRLGVGEITQRLYDIIPLLRAFRVPRPASLYPMMPWAITNPIWVDVGSDGWRPLEPPPSWCRAGDYGC